MPHARMTARDPDEEHRASTPLELFFDLTFVVAIAQAASSLHHGLVDGDARDALIMFPLVFFAHLLGVGELHVVRVGLRHRRRALPAHGVRADGRAS